MFTFRMDETIELQKYSEQTDGYLVKINDAKPPKDVALAKLTLPSENPVTHYGVDMAEVDGGTLHWCTPDSNAKNIIANSLLESVDDGFCKFGEWVWMNLTYNWCDDGGNEYNTSKYSCAQIIKGSEINRGKEIHKEQDNRGQKIGGDQINDNQIIRGKQLNQGQEIYGDRWDGKTIIHGEIHIHGLKQEDKKLQKELDEFYKTEQDKYTWGRFFKWITKE